MQSREAYSAPEQARPAGAASNEPVPVVGGIYAYYVLGVLFVVYVFNFIDRQLLAILLQPIKEDLQVSDTAMGFLTGFAFAVFYTFAGIPLARVADRWVRRSLIALSLATWSVMTAVSGLARGFPDLALARIGVGIGEAGCTPPAHSLLSDYFPPEKRATVLSLYAIGVYVGVGIGFWLGGWIHDAFGWRTAFFVLGLPGVALALLVRITVSEPPRGLSERHVVSDRDYQIRETCQFLATLPTGYRIGLAAAFHAFASYGLGAWIPTFFVRVHHMTPGELGQWLSWILALGGHRSVQWRLAGRSLGTIRPAGARLYQSHRRRPDDPVYRPQSVSERSTTGLAELLASNHLWHLMVGTVRRDCAGSRSSGDARHGFGGVHFYLDDHRHGDGAASGGTAQRLARYA